ncbi:M phase phosphoprotein 10 [Argentina anserina]|uniref:M phase phosphoprotein 10 n=1 Tax=Argentina anserina TaxID=57926 RepID=UPI0021765FC5|nr:M phase phosphoprotein 10 [Potentilla anserina]
MKQSIVKSVSLYARTRLLSQPCYKPTTQLSLSTRPRLSFYTTESQSRDPEGFKDEEDDVSNEELKTKIDDYFKGNDKAIPTIFEAILKRKLTGKHEQTDKQLMEELCGKSQRSLSNDEEEDEDDDEEIESDFDELYGSDEKAADLNKAMDKLMKEMPITKRENW